MRVASGVTSRGASPVPPVVSTTAARCCEVVDRGRDLVGLVRDDATLDVVAVAAQELLEQVAAPVLASPRETRSETVSTAAFTRLLRLLEQLDLENVIPLSIAFAMS